MSTSAELRARNWLAEQLAWEKRLEELRAAAGVAAGMNSTEVDSPRRDRNAA